MIEITKVSKQFDDILAVDHVSVSIKEGEVFGLIGTNGAGKSTLLRMIAGVMRPDRGTIVVDDRPVFDNVDIKKNIFFIADEPYYFSNSNAKDMADYYASIYEGFDINRFEHFMSEIDIDLKRRISTYSKGMKKQLSMFLGLCANTKYLLCDETFDGLDPIVRETVKQLIANEIKNRGLTPIIASHNLRELEDICDHVGLLHKGGVLLSRNLDAMKLNISKVQFVLQDSTADISKMLSDVEIIKTEQRGSLYAITVRNTKEDIVKRFETVDTKFFEVLPLTLEEIFISETEVAGYDIRKLIYE